MPEILDTSASKAVMFTFTIKTVDNGRYYFVELVDFINLLVNFFKLWEFTPVGTLINNPPYIYSFKPILG